MYLLDGLQRTALHKLLVTRGQREVVCEEALSSESHQKLRECMFRKVCLPFNRRDQYIYISALRLAASVRPTYCTLRVWLDSVCVTNKWVIL